MNTATFIQESSLCRCLWTTVCLPDQNLGHTICSKVGQCDKSLVTQDTSFVKSNTTQCRRCCKLYKVFFSLHISFLLSRYNSSSRVLHDELLWRWHISLTWWFSATPCVRWLVSGETPGSLIVTHIGGKVFHLRYHVSGLCWWGLYLSQTEMIGSTLRALTN